MLYVVHTVIAIINSMTVLYILELISDDVDCTYYNANLVSFRSLYRIFLILNAFKYIYTHRYADFKLAKLGMLINHTDNSNSPPP